MDAESPRHSALSWKYAMLYFALALVLFVGHAGGANLCCFFTTYSRAILSPIDELEHMPFMWAVLYTLYDALVVFFRFCMLISYPVCRLLAPPNCLCCK